MEEKIKAGDVVTLKHSDIEMTVGRTESVNGTNYAECIWFVGMTLDEKSIPITALKKIR